MTVNQDCNCPHCGKPLGIEAVTKIMRKSRMSLNLKPEPGSFLSTRAVGGSIEQMGTLLDAVGKDLGVKSHTIVEGISTSEDGTIKVDLLITRVGKLVQDDNENEVKR